MAFVSGGKEHLTMLTGIHFILSYTCNFECDHCFLYCSPRSRGTFAIDQVKTVLDEAHKIGTIEWIFYEGGEPFLFYPLLKESIMLASRKGFKVGVVTNAYGAITERDAALWLTPLAESGLSFLSVSNDAFHYGEEHENSAAIANAVAEKMGIETSSIAIEPPKIVQPALTADGRGEPVVGGGAMFRGRAVEKLTADLPRRPWDTLCQCPYEDLASPSRVHVDPFGHVHICQGISIGNMWEKPLSDIIATYTPDRHPICGPLLAGGPAELSRQTGVEPETGYIDECHLCYATRRKILDTYLDHLAPRQVYGVEQ
jgi:hypothetical protein